MKLGLFGISFPHAKGEFGIRMVAPHYTLCSFETPFLYEKDGVLLEGQRGDLLIMEPGHIVYHGPRKDAPEGFVNDWVQVTGQDFGELLDRYPLPRNTAFSVDSKQPLRSYLEQLRMEGTQPEMGKQDMIVSILTQMVVSLYRAYEKTHTQQPARSVKTVAEAIAQAPAHDWYLQELAKLSGYSPSRFSELYRAQYGLSPMQDVLSRRIHLAKRYLLSGQSSVDYIAEVCGFKSVSYFCKYFKQVVGCTPSKYIYFDDPVYREQTIDPKGNSAAVEKVTSA